MVKKPIFWLWLSAAVMLLLPWIVVTFVRSDAAMAAVLVLFFAVNPGHSMAAGYYSGKQLRRLAFKDDLGLTTHRQHFTDDVDIALPSQNDLSRFGPLGHVFYLHIIKGTRLVQLIRLGIFVFGQDLLSYFVKNTH